MEKNEDVISWKQLYENVGKFATVLKNQGVQKGDSKLQIYFIFLFLFLFHLKRLIKNYC